MRAWLHPQASAKHGPPSYCSASNLRATTPYHRHAGWEEEELVFVVQSAFYQAIDLIRDIRDRDHEKFCELKLAYERNCVYAHSCGRDEVKGSSGCVGRAGAVEDDDRQSCQPVCLCAQVCAAAVE